ncbi:hypothetical protein Mapa_013432 [Marchantia paleacea]|nr:hypothetical protein Mapa_013432 [Marchantia paleacea]
MHILCLCVQSQSLGKSNAQSVFLVEGQITSNLLLRTRSISQVFGEWLLRSKRSTKIWIFVQSGFCGFKCRRESAALWLQFSSNRLKSESLDVGLAWLLLQFLNSYMITCWMQPLPSFHDICRACTGRQPIAAEPSHSALLFKHRV